MYLSEDLRKHFPQAYHYLLRCTLDTEYRTHAQQADPNEYEQRRMLEYEQFERGIEFPSV